MNKYNLSNQSSKNQILNLIPNVIDDEGPMPRANDIYSRLLSSRIIFLCEPINAITASSVIAQLLHLEAEDPNADIQFFIDSPGGSADDALAIIDTMNYISCDVVTMCVGLCASAAALILASGAKGKRLCLPHSKVMIHQPLILQTGGQQTDIEITATNLKKCRDEINEVLSKATGKPIAKIQKDTERDNWLNAKEAISYGLIDKIA